MAKYSMALAVIGLVPLIASSLALADESVAGRCPAYPSHLRVARAYLAQGKRAAALAELRLAEETLRTCLREEAAGGSLFAGHVRSIEAG